MTSGAAAAKAKQQGSARVASRRPLDRMLAATAVLFALAGLSAVAYALAARRHRRASDQLLARLQALGEQAPSPSASQWDRVAIPAPVARYLDLALPAHGGVVRGARLRQVGRLRTDGRSARWLRFEAQHAVAPAATAFVWNARVSLMPLLHLRVLDSLVQGKGSGQVLLLSAFPVGADAGTPEMNSGSLHRYLAEAVWYPTALVPSEALTWQAIDDRTALATLSANGTTVSLEFRFDASGAVAGIHSPGRWGRFHGRYRQLAWEGHFRDYARRDGMLVPLHGEVGWYAGDEWQPVWEGTITEFEYRWSPQPRR